MRNFALWMAVAAAALAGCNDGAGPVVAPGDNVTNDTHEPDATAGPATSDAGADGTLTDAGDAGYPADSSYIGMSYYDAPIPTGACASCMCPQATAYCLENGASATAPGGASGGACGMAGAGTPAVGCNPIPASCAGAANPCACVLNAMTGLACVPDCVVQAPEGGVPYTDIYCPTP
jgi:hypothetical protein